MNRIARPATKIRRDIAVLAGCAVGFFAFACRPSDLSALAGSLVFSSPDQPSAVQQPDAGLVQIGFGDVTVDSTKSLTLSVASVAGTITLLSVTAVQPDSEFSLPLQGGAVVTTSASQITVGFSPTSLGSKSAVFLLNEQGTSIQTVTIVLTGTGVASSLAVSPVPVDFGQVELNQSQSVPITITNNSQLPASLVLTSLHGSNPSFFSVGAPGATSLAPGASTTLDTAFAPLVLGGASASFSIAASPGGPAVPVSLTGIGVQSELQVTSLLDFGFVQPTTTLDKSVLVTNVGSHATLHLLPPGPFISQPSGGSAFALGTNPALPVAIAPGETVSFVVSFSPANYGQFSGSLYFTSDDPGSQYFTVDLEGIGGGPHIQCAPILDFGPVPIGFPFSQQDICTNAGTDLSFNPGIGLQLSQSTLSTGNPVFTASLALPDGGPAPSDYTAFLIAGQSAIIDVTFLPPDGGVYEGRLSVPNNDLDDSDAGTLLRGGGIVPVPCDLEMRPTQLSFGEVPPQSSGLLQFEINNVGEGICELTSVALDHKSDPAFSLPGGSLGPQLLSYPQDPSNPPGLPSSLSIEVQFAPAAAEMAATGAVDIAANGSPSSQEQLSAFSQSACLGIEPTSYDFGLVGLNAGNQICELNVVTFTAENLCATNITINQIELSVVGESAGSFDLDSGVNVPTLTPGETTSFRVQFEPNSPGPKLGDLTISTSEFPNDPFLITLKGNAESDAQRIDTFTTPSPPKQVDLLWVLDEDDDLAQVSSVASLLPQFIDAMSAQGIDYQMAVTSTDTCDAGSSDQGAFEPCDHCLSTASSTPTFVTPATAGPATALAELFAFFDVPPQLALCAGVNGDEHFFDSIADAFSPALLSGHNHGFIRPDAYLAIVVVNGDPEDDGTGAQEIHSIPLDDATPTPGSGPYLTSLAEVTALVESLKPDPSMVSVSYLNRGQGTVQVGYGQSIAQLVIATGGLEIDSMFPYWQDLLVGLFAYTSGQGVYYLKTVPADPRAIQVFVNGLFTSAWNYIAEGNYILFDADELPPPGSTVNVAYFVGC